MKLDVYNDLNKFMDETFDILVENEIQNNVIIGNCLKGRDGLDTSNWFMATVKDDSGGIRFIAMMTPPYNLCAYETGNMRDDDVLSLFTRELAALNIAVPGIITEKSLAARFSDIYLPVEYKSKTKITNMRVFRLDEVNDIPVSEGKLRLATEKDLYFIPYWMIHFSLDCGLPGIDTNSAVEKVKGFLKTNSLYVWEDGFPVSQAAMGRKTLNSAVVSYVYTPTHFRGKGYASSCVASLSRYLLESGYKSCSLFTDLDNPISNSIYMKIGYKPVCDFDEYKFAAR